MGGERASVQHEILPVLMEIYFYVCVMLKFLTLNRILLQRSGTFPRCPQLGTGYGQLSLIQPW
jgi:hypothetical protein